MRRGPAIAVALVAAAAAAWFLFAPGGAAVRKAPSGPASTPGGAAPPPARSPTLASADPSVKGDDDATSERASETARTPDGSAPESSKPMKVRVRDERGPLADVEVRVRVWTTGKDPTSRIVGRTDAAGSLVADVPECDALRKPPVGHEDDVVLLELRHDGFRIRTIEVDDSEPVEEIRLERGVPFDGRVVEDATGSPVPGAPVSVEEWGDPFEVGPTDECGRFHVPGVRNYEMATVRVKLPGHVPAQVGIAIDGGRPNPSEVVIRVVRGGSVHGVVVSPEGKPVPAACVLVRSAALAAGGDDRDAPVVDDRTIRFEDSDYALRWRDEGGGSEPRLRATASADGTYSVDGLAFDHDYELVGEKAGFARSAPVNLLRATVSASTLEARVVLRKPATVHVTVATPTGRTLPSGARVRLLWGPNEVLYLPDSNVEPTTYEFVDLAPGPAVVFAQVEGYRTVARSISIAEGTSSRVTLDLDPGVVLAGTVVGPEGNRLGGATVLAGARTSNTDSQGRFEIGGLAAGDVVVDVEWGGLGLAHPLHTTAPRDELRIQLSRLGRAHVRLMSPDGTPYTGPVWTYLSYPTHGSGGTSDDVDDGFVEKTRLADGDYALLVAPTSYAWWRRSFTIRDGADVDLGEVRLGPGITISGRVVGRDGPAAGAEVTCEEFDRRTAATDAEGRFSFDRFPRETVHLRVRIGDEEMERVEVDPARSTGVEIRIRSRVHVSGRVVDAAGSPIANAGITFRESGASPLPEPVAVGGGNVRFVTLYPGSEWTASGEDGRFEVILKSGSWTLVWTDPQGKEHVVGSWTIEEGKPLSNVTVTIPSK